MSLSLWVLLSFLVRAFQPLHILKPKIQAAAEQVPHDPDELPAAIEPAPQANDPTSVRPVPEVRKAVGSDAKAVSASNNGVGMPADEPANHNGRHHPPEVRKKPEAKPEQPAPPAANGPGTLGREHDAAGAKDHRDMPEAAEVTPSTPPDAVTPGSEKPSVSEAIGSPAESSDRPADDSVKIPKQEMLPSGDGDGGVDSAAAAADLRDVIHVEPEPREMPGGDAGLPEVSAEEYQTARDALLEFAEKANGSTDNIVTYVQLMTFIGDCSKHLERILAAQGGIIENNFYYHKRGDDPQINTAAVSRWLEIEKWYGQREVYLTRQRIAGMDNIVLRGYTIRDEKRRPAYEVLLPMNLPEAVDNGPTNAVVIAAEYRPDPELPLEGSVIEPVHFYPAYAVPVEEPVIDPRTGELYDYKAELEAKGQFGSDNPRTFSAYARLLHEAVTDVLNVTPRPTSLKDLPPFDDV
jgi:hypothetical protein